MTLAEFFTDLRDKCGSWAWYLGTEGEIRLERARHEISVCPLTALVRYKTGRYLAISEFVRAAAELDLESSAAIEIIHLADNDDHTDTAQQLALLQACGLFV